MGGVTNMFSSTGSGGMGSGFTAQATPIAQTVNSEQATQGYNAAQEGLKKQQTLAELLAAQNGLGTQNSVLGQQQALASQLQSAPQTQNSILAQQQALANQLQNQANGQGPNPSQIQFGQNINAGTQAAAGAIASQKGISPALAAQMIAQQQGSANQNAAATQAALQAQQQLGAQQALGQQQAAMQGVAGNQLSALQGQQNSLQNVAGQQVGNQINQQNAAANNNIAEQGTLYNSIAGVNANNTSQANAVNSANEHMSSTNATNSANGILGIPGLHLAKGGEVKAKKSKKKAASIHDFPEHIKLIAKIHHPHLFTKYADGGDADESNSTNNLLQNSSTYQKGTKLLDKVNAISGIASAFLYKGGTPQDYTQGGQIPGKPEFNYNTEKNDVVPAMLTKHEVVLPLSVTQSKNPPAAAAKFMQSVMDKNNKKEEPVDHKKQFHKALREAVSKRKKK